MNQANSHPIKAAKPTLPTRPETPPLRRGSRTRRSTPRRGVTPLTHAFFDSDVSLTSSSEDSDDGAAKKGRKKKKKAPGKKPAKGKGKKRAVEDSGRKR